MIRQTIFLLTTSLFLAACARPASTSIPSATPANTKIALTAVATPGPDDICLPADLKTSSNASVNNGSVIAGITLTNGTGYACRLEGLPQVTFRDANGDPLPIQYQPADLNQTPPLPAALDLVPGESAIVSLIWRNACPPLPGPKISFQLTLSGGESLDVLPETLPTPPCSDKNQPSTVIISPYSYPP